MTPVASKPHRYESTYCHHEWHSSCRLTCKVCAAPCVCACHARPRTLVEVFEAEARALAGLPGGSEPASAAAAGPGATTSGVSGKPA